MYAQKFRVDVWIRGKRRSCPLEWLDQFCMRNFTNSAEFDDTLPVGEGRIEASFRLTPERFAEGLGDVADAEREGRGGNGEGGSQADVVRGRITENQPSGFLGYSEAGTVLLSSGGADGG